MRKYLLPILFLLIIVSCSTDSSLSDKDILMSGKWKIDSVTKDGRNDDAVCLKDDCYSFSKDGTFNISFGTLKCNPVETETGSYWFYDSETLVINYSGEKIYYKFFIYSGEMILICDLAGVRTVYDYYPCK